uniref:Class III signal peptide n=1 Tax=Methanococcus maripaludis (strain C6 / ATCC BAA-1332) TaxID=444158 RepID=A9A7Q0_METM6
MSNKGQLSIEMVILILAVLVSGAMVATKLTHDTFENSTINSVQQDTHSGFTTGLNTHNDDQDALPSETEEDILVLTTGNIKINPTSSIENSEFSAILVNKTNSSKNIMYHLDKNTNDLIMVFPDGTTQMTYITKDWQNFNATNITLRIKTGSVITVDGEEVTYKAGEFKINCPESQDSFTFQMCNEGGNQFYLRLVDQGVTLEFIME